MIWPCNRISLTYPAGKRLKFQSHQNRDYKKMKDIKLRSNLVKDHLQGKYCGRGEMSSKKDAERYRPQKIFKSMYHKVHVENSRNKVKGVINS